MSTTMLGAGLAGAGSSIAGFGELATADTASRATGGGCRLIDATTRDYVLQDDGNQTQSTPAQQLVQIALASIADWPKTITASYAARVEELARGALERLVRRGIIQILGVTANRGGQSRERVSVRWVDVSTGDEFSDGI